jgi:hypothetical protein
MLERTMTTTIYLSPIVEGIRGMITNSRIMPEASPNHLASSLDHNQRELLERCYLRAG